MLMETKKHWSQTLPKSTEEGEDILPSFIYLSPTSWECIIFLNFLEKNKKKKEDNSIPQKGAKLRGRMYCLEAPCHRFMKSPDDYSSHITEVLSGLINAIKLGKMLNYILHRIFFGMRYIARERYFEILVSVKKF